MRTLGIDYGRAKVGLAIGVGSFAEPYDVIRYTDMSTLIEKVGEIVKAEKVEKIVIGLSENEIGEATKKFAEALHSSLSPLPFEFFDETLSSQDAQKLSREVGMSRKKARGMEDAFAASIMLQNYLDSNK